MPMSFPICVEPIAKQRTMFVLLIAITGRSLLIYSMQQIEPRLKEHF
jgi:hypothetical protein